jgi:hypothetical protein
LLKFQIFSKFLDSADSNADIQIVFNEFKEDTLFFYIENLKPDKIGIFKLPLKIYDKTDLKKKLNKDPYSGFLTPPYVSINRFFKENSL